MGDLNNVMSVTEKLGPRPANCRLISNFCCLVKDSGFIDLGYNGPAYTWTNKRFDANPTYEHLDRFLANAEWFSNFPNTVVYHLPMLKSDHAPILAVLNSSRRRTVKPFRFENWWLLTDDYEKVAKASCQKSSTKPFHVKTAYLAKDLKRWQKSKPKNSDILHQIEDKLLDLQSKPPDKQNPSLQKHLVLQHDNILAREEAYHRQRYKKNWSVAGDRNTRFFHQSIIKRSRRNTNTHFLNQDGTYVSTHDQLADTATSYFVDIFKSDNNSRCQDQAWNAEIDLNLMTIAGAKTKLGMLKLNRLIF
jgi:hypothetical protein